MPKVHSFFSLKSLVPLLVGFSVTLGLRAAPQLEINPALNSNLKLSWPSLPEKSYRLWESPDLLSWSLMNGFPREGTGVAMEYRFVPGGGSRYYRVSEEFTAPDGLSLIPAGSFQMGDSSAGSVGGDEELPVHSVYLDAFYMGRHEVTWALWDTVRQWGDANGYEGLNHGSNRGTGIANYQNYPVFNITWTDMVKWCNARSQMEGLTPCYNYNGQVMKQGEGPPEFDRSANGYRLPTEAEWEKAARGGTAAANYYWGNTITHSNANFSSYGSLAYDLTPAPRGYHPDYDNDPTPYTAPVGSFAPNGYGLYDMSGNVNERCWDWDAANYYSNSPAANPTGPATGAARIIRGGAWNQHAGYARCSARFHAGAAAKGFDSGFRVARNVSPLPAGFALIPAGTFQMGDQSSPQIGVYTELPAHAVTTSAYLIAKYEVSGSEWAAVQAWATAHGYSDLSSGQAKAVNHPVNFITWYDAVKWCNARSEKEGLTPCYTVSGNIYRGGSSAPVCDWAASGYRLPTEAEWERAARGGRTGKNFPWGDTITHRQANYQSLAEWAAFDTSTTRGFHPSFSVENQPYTSPLANFSPNDYALADTSGNVREWCWDWADVNYYTVSPGSDPRGPATGSQRAARGGSWSADAFQARNSSRAGFSPNTRANDTGFRVARTYSGG